VCGAGQGRLGFQRLGFQLFLQDGLQAGIRTSVKVQSPAAGGLQPCVSNRFTQANDAQARAKPHLWVGSVLKDFLHDFGALRTDGSGPLDDSPQRPFQIFLMRFRTMLVQRGKPARLATANVGSDSFARFEQFDGFGPSTARPAVDGLRCRARCSSGCRPRHDNRC